MSVAAYSRLTHRYLAQDHTLRPAYIDLVRPRAAESTITVVELGCGADSVMARTLSHDCTVVGVDRRFDRVIAARRSAGAASFLVADFRSLPFADGSLDAVVTFYAMIHCPVGDLAMAMEGVHRVLRPGGLFVGSIGTACSAFAETPPPPEVTCLPATVVHDAIHDSGLTVLRQQSQSWSGDEGSVEFLFFAAERSDR